MNASPPARVPKRGCASEASATGFDTSSNSESFRVKEPVSCLNRRAHQNRLLLAGSLPRRQAPKRA